MIKDSMNNVHDDYKIKGHVKLFDKNGKLIFESDNMIVSYGRELVRDFIIASLPSGSVQDSPTAVDVLPITHVRFGNMDSATTLDSEILDTNTIIDIPLNDNNVSISFINDSADTPMGYLKIDISIKGNETYTGTISELGLVCKSGSTTKTFSRVALDPIPFDASVEFSLSYYLYF